MNDRPVANWDHPTESELADLVLGPVDDPDMGAVADHVRSCAGCRRLVDRLSAGLPDLPDDERLVASAVVPPGVLAVVRAADRPRTAPRPGELWRARPPTGGPVTVVWLREVGPREATAVPVSFDAELADERTLVVPVEESPLGLPIAFHLSVEATIATSALLDRLGALDVAADVETVRATPAGSRPSGIAVGPVIASPLDERAEYRHALADAMAGLAPARTPIPAQPSPHELETDAWWPRPDRSERATLLMAIHRSLGESHRSARITPRPPASTAVAQLGAVALLSEVDTFVLVALLEHPEEPEQLLELARQVLQADQGLSAVCMVEPGAPFMGVVVDRRDIVDAIETPSGELRPPCQSRVLAPIGETLTKFLDAAISPLGRLARTVVEAQGIDMRGLAAAVSTEAVRAVAASARGYKVEGKRPGYERVTRHTDAIIRLVEEALAGADIDVAAILEEGT
jgi:hypothetical protein